MFHLFRIVLLFTFANTAYDLPYELLCCCCIYATHLFKMSKNDALLFIQIDVASLHLRFDGEYEPDIRILKYKLANFRWSLKIQQYFLFK